MKSIGRYFVHFCTFFNIYIYPFIILYFSLFTSSLFTSLSSLPVDFYCLAGNGEPDGGALALVGVDVDGAVEPLDELVTDSESETCTFVSTCHEALEDAAQG